MTTLVLFHLSTITPHSQIGINSFSKQISRSSTSQINDLFKQQKDWDTPMLTPCLWSPPCLHTGFPEQATQSSMGLMLQRELSGPTSVQHLASLCLKGLTGQTVNSELWHTQSPNTVFKVSQETEYQTIFTVYSSKGWQIMYKLDKHNRANRHPTQAHAAKQETTTFSSGF